MSELKKDLSSSERPPFGVDWMRRYLGHFMQCPLSQLHIDLANDLHDIQQERGQRRNYIAPRGSAKSSWISLGYVLYGALEGIEPLTLILAETGKQARLYLESIKTELETNPAIARDYPQSAGRGNVWQAERIRLGNGSEIVVRGSGGRVLGMRRRNRRPTLVVGDDCNERGDAYSETKRQRKIDWWTRDVMPVGEPGTNFVVAGTPIHRQAIVCHLRDAGWKTRLYDAMTREPDRRDLWQQWERALCNLADPHREETALAMYRQHRDEMDAGAELLWPARMTLYSLMSYRAQNGESAYLSEYTSDPGAPIGAEWPSSHFDRAGFWFEDWPTILRVKCLALDPSKGSETGQGDYQAHAMVGIGEDGTIYVDCDLRREHPEAMVERTVRTYREWTEGGRLADRVVVEDNGTMGLISGAIQASLGANIMPWECLTQVDRKDLRIRVIGPYLSQKRVRVRNTPGGRILVKQWREFPYGDHDDGPDAVATAIRWLQQAMRKG